MRKSSAFNAPKVRFWEVALLSLAADSGWMTGYPEVIPVQVPFGEVAAIGVGFVLGELGYKSEVPIRPPRAA